MTEDSEWEWEWDPDTCRRGAYWTAKRQLDGLVEHVAVGLDTRLRPYLEIEVADSTQRFCAEGATEDLDRVQLERSG